MDQFKNIEDEDILGGSDETGWSWVNYLSSGFSISQNELATKPSARLFAKAQPTVLIVVYVVIIIIVLVCIIMIWSVSGGEHMTWGIILLAFCSVVVCGFAWRFKKATDQVSYLSQFLTTPESFSANEAKLKKMADEESNFVASLYTANIAKTDGSAIKSIYNLSQPFELNITMIVVIILIAIILIIVAAESSSTIRDNSLNSLITLMLVGCIGLYCVSIFLNKMLGGIGYKHADDMLLNANKISNATSITMTPPIAAAVAAG